MSLASPADQDASRPRSGILTPGSEGSLQRHDGSDVPSSQGVKRKRSGSVAMDHLLKPMVSFKPHPPNLHIQPRNLQPLMLVPREHILLSYIDLQAPAGEFTQSRFFDAHIKILDLESRVATKPSLLVARNETKGTLYAVERQSDGLYVLCKLGSWVDLQVLAQKATVLLREKLQTPEREPLDGTNPSQSGGEPKTSELFKPDKKKRAAIEAIQSLVRKKARPEPPSNLESQNTTALAGQQISSDSQPSTVLPTTADGHIIRIEDAHIATKHSTHDSPTAQQTPESIFDTIRSQYFEALYKSKGSLAYFAKGPLSRARSTFHLDLESNLDMSDLIDFLKSLILTTVQVDKKFRETIPGIIANMKTLMESSDEGARKKKKAKKMKLGRDALYPAEADTISRWWSTNKPELAEEQTNPSAQQIKSHVSLLRTRETQLQMIIILEILALESTRPAEDTGENSLPTLPGASNAEELMGPPVTKKRSKHNLPVLLDVHADRLTIWQSTASDEQLLLEDSQVSQQLPNGEMQQTSSSEPLKDFCVDVIVPFFSARLPSICDPINRKLGGPVIVSPPKAKQPKNHSSKREPKPGSAARRTAATSAPRTLQRALSTEQQHRRSVSRGPSNMIALMRSATTTSLTGFKREGSEPLALNAVPRKGSETAGPRQSMLSRSKSMVNVNEVKASKKAQVEAELKDAISALRKPNREVVGKAMAEAAERRATTSSSVKKNKKLPRGQASSNIQVKATPANNRFKNVFTDDRESLPNVVAFNTDDLIPPSSVGTLVPSTAPRNGLRDALPANMSPIASTPIKRNVGSSFLRRPVQGEYAIPPSSPLISRHSAGPDSVLKETPVKTSSRLNLKPPEDDRFVLATPVKSGGRMENANDGPLSAQPQEKQASIYERLGWDNDFDDI